MQRYKIAIDGFEQDGIRHHHILDTKTEYPASSRFGRTVVFRDFCHAVCISRRNS